MAYLKTIVTAMMIRALIENKGIYQDTNRAFDSYVNAGAEKIQIPKLAGVKIKREATAGNSADRTNAKGSTSMVDVDIEMITVPLAEEVEARFTEPRLLQEYVNQSTEALQKEYSRMVIETAQTTSAIDTFKGASVELPDFVGIKKYFDGNEVAEDKRIVVIDSDLQDQIWDIDIIQKAAAFNKEALESGIFVKLFGFKIYVSALAPKIGGKSTITAWDANGLAFLLAKEMQRKEVYSETLRKDIIDIHSFAGTKLFGDEYAYVLGEQ